MRFQEEWYRWKRCDGRLAETNGHWASVRPMPDDLDVDHDEKRDNAMSEWLAPPEVVGEIRVAELTHWLARFGTMPEPDWDMNEGATVCYPIDAQLVGGVPFDRWVIRDATLSMLSECRADTIRAWLAPNENGSMLILECERHLAIAQCLRGDATPGSDPLNIRWPSCRA